MIVNLKLIYEKNIVNKYNILNKEQFYKDYTPKQQSMWLFALSVLKKEPYTSYYDSEKDKIYLNNFLDIFVDDEEITKFTLQEWFDYMKSNL